MKTRLHPICYKLFLSYIFILCGPLFVFSQAPTNETIKYIDKAHEHYPGDCDSVVFYSIKALDKAQELDYKEGMWEAYFMLGEGHVCKGNYEQAKVYLEKSLSFINKGKFTTELAKVSNALGIVYHRIGDYDEALEHYYEALTIWEKLEEYKSVTMPLGNIGKVYEALEDYDKAEIYYQKQLTIAEKHNISDQRQNAYNHMGSLELTKENYDLALNYFKKAQEIAEENGNKSGQAHAYNNIAIVYYYKNDVKLGIEYFKKGLTLRREVGDPIPITESLVNVGFFYQTQGDYSLAVKYYEESYQLALSVNAKQEQVDALLGKAEVKKLQGKFEEAYKIFMQAREIETQILSEKSRVAMAEMEAKYETERKELEIDNLNKEKALDKAEIERKDVQLKWEYAKSYAFIFGFIIALSMALVVYRGYRNKKKSNEIISEQKREVEEKKLLIEEKNKEITDSLKCAERIQNSLFPTNESIKQYLPESFILYKPKDIVSGDFYWVEKLDNKILLAVVDCTGHGVPGAFVSVIGYTGLERTIKEFGLRKPAEILDKLNEIVENSFTHTEEDVKEGMDIAICSLDIENKTLEYAGANNPVYIVREGELTEIKANKQPIGKFADRQPFTNHVFELESGDNIYVFSDGYADQFGGEKGKKYKYSAFRKMFVDNYQLSFAEQGKLLDNTFENWRGDFEQVDDVCVVGVRV